MVVLSPAQQKTVEYLIAHHGILIRFPGGFWTTADTPLQDGTSLRMPWGVGDTAAQAITSAGVPSWWVAISTVRALEKRGMLVRMHRYAEEWRDEPAVDPGPGATQGRRAMSFRLDFVDRIDEAGYLAFLRHLDLPLLVWAQGAS